MFAVAIEAYPDTPRDQLVYVNSPSLSVACETTQSACSLTPIDLDVGPCTASASLANELEKFEYRYLSGTNCMLGKSTDSITVTVDEEGRSEIHYQELTGGGRRHSVECDENFYNSPLPLIEAPD